jgi:hypothetical protein
VDRLAFVYFEQQNNDVYLIQNPRALKRQPWRPAAPENEPIAERIDAALGAPPPPDTIIAAQIAAEARADSIALAARPAPTDTTTPPPGGVPQAKEGGSI